MSRETTGGHRPAALESWLHVIPPQAREQPVFSRPHGFPYIYGSFPRQIGEPAAAADELGLESTLGRFPDREVMEV